MAVERILSARPATLAVTFTDSAGQTTDPGEVTVTITREDGTAVVTDVAADGTGIAPRTYALTGAQTVTLDTLTAAWTSATLGTLTTKVEIVGDRLFSVSEARAFDKQQLASQSKYPDAAILDGLRRIEDDFQRICGVSFIPRYKRLVMDGSGRDALLAPDLRVNAIRSIETRSGTTWTAFTQEQLDDVVFDGAGILVRELYGPWPSGRRNVRIGYEYGWDVPPEPIRRAAMKVLIAQIIPTNLNDRVTSETTENATYAYSTAGRVNNPWSIMPQFGIPEVDVVLDRYSEKVPGIA
ncbi:hypothetical protein [Nitrolancea hollandica]|uniref:Uncharacterized protein n=1 Tax=Nitrolancea hollandica Lb TaxID=1129897 RepID=I4EG31_9BACT|nr:hypothetical protein [Nitrolancea hollandica]CCF83643.1 hypothetical protein NITHO_2520018 [Nitrolancea hollandica Lb]